MSTVIQEAKIRHLSKSSVNYAYQSVEKGNFALEVPQNSLDFVYVPFRHISAGTVGQGTGKSTEFPAAILRASLPLFRNLNVYLDHNRTVGQEVGSVLNASWNEGYTLPNGQRVPAGIEAVIEVDNVLYNDLARKLTQWSVKLHSMSVGVSFKYKKSHEDMSDEEFMRNRGQLVGDNEVRLIATEVTKYWETSIVYEGADRHAKRIGSDGQIEVYNKEKEEQEIETFEFELPNYTNDKPTLFEVMENKKDNKEPKAPVNETQEVLNAVEATENESKDTDMPQGFSFSFEEEENKELFSSALNEAVKERGLSVLDTELYNATVTELEDVKALLSQRNTEATSFEASLLKVNEQFTAQKELTNEAQTQLAAQQTERENLTTQLETLQAERESEKAVYSYGLETLTNLKAQAKQEYEVFARESVNEAILAKIEAETSPKELETLIEMYSGKAAEKFGSRCSECGSGKVEYRSSIASTEGNKEAVKRNNDFADFGAKFRKFD